MITVKIKNTNLTPNELLNNFIRKKIKDLIKYIPENFGAIAEVEVGKTMKHQKSGDIFRAEIQIQVPGGKLLRAVSEKGEMQSAVIEAANDLAIQFEKYKSLLSKGVRRRRIPAKGEEAEE
jgi:ribosomal subunit interface protein